MSTTNEAKQAVLAALIKTCDANLGSNAETLEDNDE